MAAARKIFGGGDMNARKTSYQIACYAGVSQPTVSRALRGSPLVSKETRERIQAIARELNYTVDKNASSLRLKSTRTLALLLFEEQGRRSADFNPLFLSMIPSITLACAARGIDLLVSFQKVSGKWQIDHQLSRKADGVILLGYGRHDEYEGFLQSLMSQSAHFVRWGSPDQEQIGLMVGCDNVGGGFKASEHLTARGRRRIAFLGALDSHLHEFRDRHLGYQRALAAAGLSYDPELVVSCSATRESGYDVMDSLLARRPDVDAVFAASDMIAIGALGACHDRGLSVPNDVAVAGFDDIPAASMTTPSLTTVAQDVDAAAETLVSALLNQINNEPNGLKPHAIKIPAQLVVRQSTGGGLH
jgi:DNA-binding LacI/PurR family transcriptional regulator